MHALESSANCTFCQGSISRWIGLRLDLTCGFMAITTSIFCIFFKGTIATDMLIFSLQVTMDIVVFFSVSIRFATEVHDPLFTTG